MVALAYESARAKSQEVVEVVTRSTEADSVILAEAWLNLGAAQRALGEPAYTQAITRAARLANSVGRTDLVAQAAALSTWPGTFFFIAEDIDNEMVELCENALEALSPNDSVRVRVLATLASHLTFHDDRARRVALIAEARSLADRLGDPLLIAHVLNAEFMSMWEPDTFERRQQIGREMGRIARATGDLETEFLGGFFRAFCTAESGDLPAARDELGELTPIAEATRHSYFMFLTERLLLSIDIARGVPDCAQRVDDLAVRYGSIHADTDGTWALQTGGLAYQAGTLGEMVNVVQAMTTGQQARTWLAALALAHLWAGDEEAAAAVLDAQGSTPRNYFWITVTQVQAEVAVAVGDDARRRRLFDELLPYRGRVGITASGSLCFGLISRTLGELALSLGNLDAAVDLLTDAIAHADRTGMTAERVIGRVSLATTLRAISAPDSADCLQIDTIVSKATALASAAGMRRHLALLADLALPA
jgi:hypothetical protein